MVGVDSVSDGRDFDIGKIVGGLTLPGDVQAVENARKLVLEFDVFLTIRFETLVEAATALLAFLSLVTQRLEHFRIVLLDPLFHLADVLVQMVQLRVEFADFFIVVLELRRRLVEGLHRAAQSRRRIADGERRRMAVISA